MFLADLIRFTHEVTAKVKEKTNTLTSCTPSVALGWLQISQENFLFI